MRVRSPVWLLMLAWLCFAHLAVAEHFEYRAQGYSLDYPDTWKLNQGMIDLNGPLLLTTFANYLHSGVLPEGGMEINVLAFPSSPTTRDDELLSLGLNGREQATRSVQTINGRRVARVEYDSPMGPGLTYRCTALVVRVGNKAFRILLTSRHAMPNTQDITLGEAALAQIVSSLSAPATP